MPISKIPEKGTQDLFNNISDQGTEGTKVATGTTAQRGSTTGQWRFNTSTGFFEGRNSAGTFSTLEPTPIVSSVDVTEVDSQAGGNQTIVITGENFSSGAVATFVGSTAQFDASTTTVDSATQITAVAPKSSFLNAQEPYKVKVSAASGLGGTSATGLINVDSAPSWTTSAGSLGTLTEIATGNHFTVAATDADGDTIAYSLQSGSLGGLSLNSSTGVISGDPTDVSSDTTNSFTLRATANGKTADRAFTYVTKNVNTGLHAGIASSSMTGGTAWFDSSSSYHGVENTSAMQFAASDLITQFQTRKGTSGAQDFWMVVYEKSTNTNAYVIIAAWKFSHTNVDAAVTTHLCSNATATVTHNGLSMLSGNRFIIPTTSTATNGTGNYYLGWVSQDGSGSGAIYVDSSSGGQIDYIDTSTLATNLSLSAAMPDDIASGTEIVMTSIDTGNVIHMNASGS